MDSQLQIRRPSSLVRKYSGMVSGHKTSMSLEPAFHAALKDIADSRGITVTFLLNTIDFQRKHANLSSAIRLYCLEHYKTELAKARRVVVGIVNG